jgi:hypothetical protein
MRSHLVSHFIQQLFAGHAVPLAGNVRAYCGIAGDPIDASHNRLPASTSHMQSVCSHRVQLPLSLEWPIAASFGLLGGIIAAECGDTAPSRIVRGDFAKTQACRLVQRHATFATEALRLAPLLHCVAAAYIDCVAQGEEPAELLDVVSGHSERTAPV